MKSAAEIVAQACEDAHVPGFTAQGEAKLQIILDTLCDVRDYSAARGVYYFQLNPSLTTSFGGFPNFSGPYPLPLDYLRTSGSTGSEGVQWSFFYVVSGTPFQLIPWDLGKLDQQIQQPSSQTYPWAYATDMATETTAQDRLAGTTTAKTTKGSMVIEVASTRNMLVGMSVAGLGIAPGSTILIIGEQPPPQPGPPVPTLPECVWDTMIWDRCLWSGAPAGAGGVEGIWDSMVWDVDLWAPVDGDVGNGGGGGGTTPPSQALNPNLVTLSLPATGTFNGASIMFGTPPVAYIYPGPSGAFPATLRYQRLMPPLIDFDRIPWFPNQEILLERLTAMLMSGADDERREVFFARADKLLGDYDTLSDDKTSRAQTVVMDANNFRSTSRRRLPITKSHGWAILLPMFLPLAQRMVECLVC